MIPNAERRHKARRPIDDVAYAPDVADLIFVDPGLEEFAVECPACAREEEHGTGAGAPGTVVRGEVPLDRDWIECTCARGHTIRVVREGSEGARH